MSEPHAFFEPQPDGSVMATPWARGPWDVNAQHGGPPSALLARALEQLLGDANADWLPARTNIEIRKPVPIDVLTAVATIDKQGKSVLRASAVLQHRDVTVAQAQFLMLRRLPSDATLVAEIAERLPPPDDFTPFAFPFFRHEIATTAPWRSAWGTPGRARAVAAGPACAVRSSRASHPAAGSARCASQTPPTA